MGTKCIKNYSKLFIPIKPIQGPPFYPLTLFKFTSPFQFVTIYILTIKVNF